MVSLFSMRRACVTFALSSAGANAGLSAGVGSTVGVAASELDAVREQLNADVGADGDVKVKKSEGGEPTE